MAKIKPFKGNIYVDSALFNQLCHIPHRLSFNGEKFIRGYSKDSLESSKITTTAIYAVSRKSTKLNYVTVTTYNYTYNVYSLNQHNSVKELMKDNPLEESIKAVDRPVVTIPEIKELDFTYTLVIKGSEVLFSIQNQSKQITEQMKGNTFSFGNVNISSGIYPDIHFDNEPTGEKMLCVFVRGSEENADNYIGCISSTMPKETAVKIHTALKAWSKNNFKPNVFKEEIDLDTVTRTLTSKGL